MNLGRSNWYKKEKKFSWYTLEGMERLIENPTFTEIIALTVASVVVSALFIGIIVIGH